MKNTVLFLLAAGIFPLISCGTANRAAYTDTSYRNGIYYTPDTRTAPSPVRTDDALAQLQQKTGRTLESGLPAAAYDSRSNVQTVFIGDTNRIDLNYRPDITYSLIDDDESYEARLRKFDSPVYTVNIHLDSYWGDPWYNPWWGPYYGWYRPHAYAWGAWGAWHRPWRNAYWSWYGPGWPSPWRYAYRDPWWNPYYGWPAYAWGGWYDPWYNPWWGAHYGWYAHNRYPGPGPARTGRDILYGRRITGSGGPVYAGGSRTRTDNASYRRNPTLNPVRGNTQYTSGSDRPASGQAAAGSGSAYRREGNTRVQNGTAYNPPAAGKSQTGTAARPAGTAASSSGTAAPARQSSSMYRRSTSTSAAPRSTGSATSAGAGYNRNARTGTSAAPARNGSSNNGSTYNRSVSGQNGSSGYSRSSGISSGNSGNSGNTGRSGGSSYRR